MTRSNLLERISRLNDAILHQRNRKHGYLYETPAQTMETTRYDQAKHKCKTVPYNNNDKKSHVPETGKTENPYLSTNRFAPLTNLNESKQDDAGYTSKNKLPPGIQPPIKFISQRRFGSKYL